MGFIMTSQSLQKTKKIKVALVAGEESGDKLGAGLMTALRESDSAIEFEGVGGSQMLAQGLNSIFPMDKLSVMGIGAILKRLPELLGLRKKLIKRWIEETTPDIFIGIDAPEFNTGLELKLKQHGIKTIHYVSPSIWAWRPGRIKKIKRAVDYMLTLFPFENSIYENHNIPVTCVGHPMAYEIQENHDKDKIRKLLKLNCDDCIIALLPGSRGSELKYLAPLFFKVATTIHQHHPELKFVTVAANTKCRQILQKQMNQYPQMDVRLFQGNSREVMAAADVLLISSGTATLEGALINRPMIVSYQVSALSYIIFSALSRLKYYALPNLLAQKEIVPEYLQYQASVKNLVEALNELCFSEKNKSAMKAEFSMLHQQLKSGGNILAAEIVLQQLDLQS